MSHRDAYCIKLERNSQTLKGELEQKKNVENLKQMEKTERTLED